MPQTLLYGKISDCFRPCHSIASKLSCIFFHKNSTAYIHYRDIFASETQCVMIWYSHVFSKYSTWHLILSHFTLYHYLLVIINNNRWTRYQSFMDKNSKWRNQSDNSTLYKRKSRACKVYMEERRKWCSGIYRQESFAGKCHQGAGWGVHLWGHQCQTARKQCHRGSHRECFYHCRSQM